MCTSIKVLLVNDEETKQSYCFNHRGCLPSVIAEDGVDKIHRLLLECLWEHRDVCVLAKARIVSRSSYTSEKQLVQVRYRPNAAGQRSSTTRAHAQSRR